MRILTIAVFRNLKIPPDRGRAIVGLENTHVLSTGRDWRYVVGPGAMDCNGGSDDVMRCDQDCAACVFVAIRLLAMHNVSAACWFHFVPAQAAGRRRGGYAPVPRKADPPQIVTYDHDSFP